MRTRLAYAVSGILATMVGLAAGHLTAALLDAASSPVLAIGSTVIDLTPTPVKEWAVREFGTRDKPILIGSVLVGTLLLAAVAGLLARRRLVLGAGLLVAMVTLAGVAALARPAGGALDAVPAVVAGMVGVLALVLLIRALRAAREARAVDRAANPDPNSVPGPETRAEPGLRRRPLLVASGLAAAAAAAGGVGQWLVQRATALGDLVLPVAAQALPPLPAGLDVPGLSPYRTPNADFYRIDTALVVPSLDVGSWSLTVDGDVRRKVKLGWDELTSMPLLERDITLNCVSNEVGGPYIGSARWLGVRLTDVLDLAGVGESADQILSTATDGFTVSTPLSLATDGRDAMVAIGMNGEPLPREHGFPARLLVPGLYGFVGATKWLTRLTLTTYDDAEAYWTQRGWATDAPVRVQSRIDTPRALSTVRAGRVAVGGVAWAQPVGVAKVAVSVDGGPWEPARLSEAAGGVYWRQWVYVWDAPAGQHRLAVRATTTDGVVQTAVRRTPFPSGATGIQEVVVNVA